MSRTTLAALLSCLVIAGCGGGGGGGGGTTDTPTGGDPVPGDGLTLSAAGGGASGSATSSGGRGGNLAITGDGNILVGVQHPPLAPLRPAAPNDGTKVSSWFGLLTISSGNAIIDGTVTAGTTGTEATLNVTSGDLVISGSLLSGDNGLVETHLNINVPGGTVWISGSIRTGRVDDASNGDNAGNLKITAQRIIFTGSIDARGEDNAGTAGNDGGSVTFDTSGAGTGQTSQILVGGSINMSGGDVSGTNARGGDGGAFRTFSPSPGAANGTIHIFGTDFASTGGSASGAGPVVGGNGGDLDLEGNAGVFFHGSFSGVGGSASASSGDATAGRGGAFLINQSAIYDSGSVAVYGSVNTSGGTATGTGVMTGGAAGYVLIHSGSDINLGMGSWSVRGADSAGRGGEGGDVTVVALGDIAFDGALDASDGDGSLTSGVGMAPTIEFSTFQGDIILAGAVSSNGGDGSDAGVPGAGPSDGGIIRLKAGHLGGSIELRGTLQANGGSDSNPDNPNGGGRGGVVQFTCVHTTGSIMLAPQSWVQADGGNGGGLGASAAGGEGGKIDLLTGGGSIGDKSFGGNITLRGTIKACGGTGSTGGVGGQVTANSDSTTAGSGGNDGRGGDITLDTGGVIDVCGGPGGGNALNNGTGTVTAPVAVTFDADGKNNDNPAENGVVQNLGTILARGTGSGTRGGDIRFDGMKATFVSKPLPGTLDLSGDVAGGDFLAQ